MSEADGIIKLEAARVKAGDCLRGHEYGEDAKMTATTIMVNACNNKEIEKMSLHCATMSEQYQDQSHTETIALPFLSS